MYVLPEDVKKPTKFLYFLNGWKALVVFVVVNVICFFGFFVMNAFIGLIYVFFVVILSIVLTVPSQRNPKRLFAESIVFHILRRREFDSDEEKRDFKEIFERARQRAIKYFEERGKRKIQKRF